MKHLLSSTAFLVLNKELARQVGLKGAVLLADLISKEEYFIARGMTDGWFFNTEANIEKDTTLTAYQQRKCLKTLKKAQLIEVKRKGIPAKQYFKINEELVMQLLNNLSATNSITINKNKEIIINNKYFNKPTILEVKNYCILRKNNIDPEAFIAFYESKGWMIGKNKMKDWKQAVITWEKRQYKKPTMSKIDSQINEYLKGKEYL
jgi:hypothetical protein|tara:strand:- start:24 stop:641 length:618 start_codon:yes stop_codon:yes gene_type:complete